MLTDDLIPYADAFLKKLAEFPQRPLNLADFLAGQKIPRERSRTVYGHLSTGLLNEGLVHQGDHSLFITEAGQKAALLGYKKWFKQSQPSFWVRYKEAHGWVSAVVSIVSLIYGFYQTQQVSTISAQNDSLKVVIKKLMLRPNPLVRSRTDSVKAKSKSSLPSALSVSSPKSLSVSAR